MFVFLATVFLPFALSTETMTCNRVNEVFSECSKHCEPECSELLLKGGKICTRECSGPGCMCKKGTGRHPNGTCVAVKECPFEGFQCNMSNDEYVDRCGDDCEKNCANLDRACNPDLCTEPACVCKEGLVRQGNFCRPIATCRKPKPKSS